MNDMKHAEHYRDLVILILIYYLNSCDVNDFDDKFSSNKIFNNIKKNNNIKENVGAEVGEKDQKIDNKIENIDINLNLMELKQKIFDIIEMILFLESSADTQTEIGFLFRSLKFSLFEKFCFLLSLFYIYDERVRIIISCLDDVSDFGISLGFLSRMFEVLKKNINLIKLINLDDTPKSAREKEKSMSLIIDSKKDTEKKVLKSEKNLDKSLYKNILSANLDFDFEGFERFQEIGELSSNVLGLNSPLNCDRQWKQKVVLVSVHAQDFVLGVDYISQHLGNIVSDVDSTRDVKSEIQNINLLSQLDSYIKNLWSQNQKKQKNQDKPENISENISKNELNILLLSGARGSGKRTQIQVMGFKYGFDVIFIDFNFLRLKSHDEILLVMGEIVLDAILFQKLICFCNFKSQQVGIMEQIISYLRKYFSFVVFLTENEFCDFDFGNIDDEKFVITNIYIPDLTEKERCFFWNKFLLGRGICDIDKKNTNDEDIDEENIKKIARGFLLTVGKIKSVSRKYFLRKTSDFEENIKLLKRLASEASGYDFGNLATRVKHGFDWDDLVLDENCKSKLLNICDRVKFKDKVYDELNFKSKFPYGSGISALFYGPPGTGKTMAAKIIADCVGCELYKIDLSQIIDKYVGETEKNLKNIFDMAEKTNVILFFDEADAIFSKRTNISDANDKYSNLEISYLLQRIEEYRGICILATNFLSSFDEAFKRRIKFVIKFNLPDVNERLLLWKKAFPPQVKISDDIDFLRLSEKFELTGSSIKLVALSAAFYAIKDQDTNKNIVVDAQNKNVIEIKHIKMALKDEFEKNGKIFSGADLELY